MRESRNLKNLISPLYNPALEPPSNDADLPLGALVEHKSFLDKVEEEKKEEAIGLPTYRISKAKIILASVKNDGRKNLVETEAREILKRYSIPTSHFRLAESEDEGVPISDEM